jgi:daunorubicin resistance ABC transporter membrane protein
MTNPRHASDPAATPTPDTDPAAVPPYRDGFEPDDRDPAAGGRSATGTAVRERAVAVVPVQLAASGPAHALRAVKVVFEREMIRFVRSKGRLISGLAQPLLLLFVLGSGLSGLTRSATGGVDFKTFLFPGIVATSTLFTAIFAGISIVWDREFGFLREMLVAPVPRSAILVGKCLGGAAIATAQALILVALAGLVGVPYDPVMIVELLALLFLTALAMTAFGLMISARIKKFQTVMPIVQLVLTPMMFLSGSLFPLAGLPVWLAVLTRINPLSYAVEPMRHAVFARLDVPAGVLARLDPGVSWGGWVVPVWLDILVIAALGAAMLAVAAVQFRRTD